MFAAVALMGVLAGPGAGVLRLGKFIRMVPHPVMLGFVNGLAIVIFLAQLGQFKSARLRGGAPVDGGGAALHHARPRRVHDGDHLFAAEVDQGRSRPRLVAIVCITLGDGGLRSRLAHHRRLPAHDDRGRRGIAWRVASRPFAIPMVPFTLETFRIILPFALILAAVGLIESLLTLDLGRRAHRDARSRQPGVRGTGSREHHLRLLRRHGRLRDDRPKHDQHQLGRPRPDLGHHRFLWS